MYPSSNNNGTMPQISSSLLSNYYNDNIHSTPPQEHFPSPIYIPLEDEAIFYEFFQQFFYNDQNRNIVTNDGDEDQCDYNYNNHVEPVNESPRKRSSSNKDRHSKINTARGPRDRRVRLSLDVAKQLFELQDLLGFDKASKTVDWLLNKSKTAILDLVPERSNSSMPSTAECIKTKAKSCSGSSKKQKEKVTGVSKQTRVKARQRARERTIEKKNNYKDSQDQVIMDQDVNQFGSNFQFSQGYVGDNSSLLMTGNCAPSYFFDNYQHSSGIIDEHRFNDLQTKEIAWEGNN